MGQAKDLNIVQPTIQDRWQEHKRRLLELTLRDDPVLLASCVFGKRIWRKRFNVKECQINVVDLALPLDKKKMKISNKVNELIRQSNVRLESVLKIIKNSNEATTKQCPKKEFTTILDADVKKREDFHHVNHLLLKDSDIKAEFKTDINLNELSSFPIETSSRTVPKIGKCYFHSFDIVLLFLTLLVYLLPYPMTRLGLTINSTCSVYLS